MYCLCISCRICELKILIKFIPVWLELNGYFKELLYNSIINPTKTINFVWSEGLTLIQGTRKKSKKL